MIDFLFIFCYLLIGFTIARWQIIKGTDLIFNDAGIHQFLFTILWLPVIVFYFIFLIFRAIAFLIDPILKRF